MKRIFIYIIFLMVFVFSMSASQLSEMKIPQIVEQYGKAIVLIATVESGKESVGLGSGFIVDPNGIIVTNFHVIQGAYPVYIKLASGDIYDEISIIDFDERRDIAVLKIKAWNLPTVKLGDSDSVLVGEKVLAIGNPRGLEHSVSDGLISGKRDTGEGFILHQISAPISPGSSGSPVFNLKGEVIGIASSSLIEGQNLNFAIPINYARGLISDNIKMSLEEFSKIKVGSSTLGKTKLKQSNIATVLVTLNEILTKTYQAYDSYIFGIYKTLRPHDVVFKPNKFSISLSLYYAKELIDLALEEIDRLNSQYDIPLDFHSRYRKIIMEVKIGIDTTINGLKKFSSVGSPDWDAVKQGSAKIHTILIIIGNSTNRDFARIFEQYIPEVKSLLLPIVLMSEFPTNYPVQLGLTWALGRRDIFLISVDKDGLAYKAGLVPGDIIIREKNEKPFSSIIDFHYFLMRQKKGNKIRLFFNRDANKYYADIRF